MSTTPGGSYPGASGSSPGETPYDPSDLPPVAESTPRGPAPPMGTPPLDGTDDPFGTGDAYGAGDPYATGDPYAAGGPYQTGDPLGGAASVGAPAGGASVRGGDDLPGEPLSSVGDLISDIAENLSTLVRQETELAKAELKQSATRAGKGAGMFGGAGLAGYFVLLFLSIALWWLIGHFLGLGWSALIVAGVWAIIAAVLASMGRNELKRVQGMPRTVETAKQIPDAMKGNEDPR